jgi:hypothetical protein
MRNNGILHLQAVGPVLVELVSPEMRIALGIVELGMHAQPVATRLHAAFEHKAHAQILADLPHIDWLALVSESGRVGDDETVPKTREPGGQFVADDIG